jgi:hypothetical protein
MIRYVALAVALVLAVPSEAGEYWDWGLGSGSPTARHRARIRHFRRHNYEPKVMAFVKREPEPEKRDDGWQCLDKVRGLGTQWIGTEGALDAAKKDWMERVRYDHGESYIDMTNAKEFESRCGRTSIGEIAGQVTYRCEIMARPCKPPMQEVKRATK